MANTEFSQTLQTLLKKKGTSQKYLALSAGYSPTYVNLLLSGKKPVPSERVVKALAEALDLSEEEKTTLFEAAEYVYLKDNEQQTLGSEQKNQGLKIDWGDAPNVRAFYGREDQLKLLKQWILDDRRQMVVLLGMGGVGKTMLAAKLANVVDEGFKYIYWRSLKDAPPFDVILRQCIAFFSNQQHGKLPDKPEDKVLELIRYLRENRCLLILDNVEAIIQGGKATNEYRVGYEGYGILIRMMGEIQHSSCLILTTREKPNEVALLEGIDSPVRVAKVEGLNVDEGQQVLRDKGVLREEIQVEEANDLIEFYDGNPLALKVVSELIREVYAGDIGQFLKGGYRIYADLERVLDEQFERLPLLEQEVMYWLAIEREATSLNDLQSNFLRSIKMEELTSALRTLTRRSLIEIGGYGEKPTYTLQSVIMEYVTGRFVKRLVEEIHSGTIRLLNSFALMKAQDKEYIRNTQIHLILKEIAQLLQVTVNKDSVKSKLDTILTQLHACYENQSGYAAGNILNLLIQLEYTLTGYDFSHLYICEAYLHNVALTDVNFSYARFDRVVLTDTFRSVLSVALSPDDHLLAAGTENNQVRLWDVRNGSPLRTYKGHNGRVRAVAFSPDGDKIVSGSEDNTVRLWSTEADECLEVLSGHSDRVRAVAFSPDGGKVVSGGDDQKVLVWEAETGQLLTTCSGHLGGVRAVAFNPQGDKIASGGDDCVVRLWDAKTGQALQDIQAMEGHTGQIHSVCFNPTGNLLVSGSEDRTIRLWNAATGGLLSTLEGHTNQVRSVAFTYDGSLIVSGSDDQTVRVWSVQSGDCLRTLTGHTHRVYSVAPAHRTNMIVSGSEDQTVKIWDAGVDQCLKTLHGYVNQVRSVDFSPDGLNLVSGGDDHVVRQWDIRDIQQGHLVRNLRGHTNGVRSVCFNASGNLLASGSDDRTVRIWNASNGNPRHILEGHKDRVRDVTFNPKGSQLASGSEDRSVRVWDPLIGRCLHVLQGHTDWVRTVAYSPDGLRLASGSEDCLIKLWNVQTGACIQTLQEHEDGVRSVVFSPDGTLLASSSDDETIKIWNGATGELLRTLQGNARWVLSLSFSPDSTTLASGNEDHTIQIWNVNNGECLQTLEGHEHRVYSVVFNRGGDMVASGSLDGTIRLWNISTATCLKVLKIDLPYERMNITGVQGLSEAQPTILKTLGAFEDSTASNLSNIDRDTK